MSKQRRKQPTSRLVALDTMVLVWGMRDRPSDQDTEHQREMRIRSRILLHVLDEEQARIIVTAVTVSELLIPIPEQQRGAFLTALQERFHCVPFDLHAAALAAELWNQHKTFPKGAEYKDRPLLRSDTLIIASAKAAGAAVFYSHDAKCRKLASAVMTAEDLPKRHPDMFLDKDIREGRA